jgi:hypothetical protein
MRLSQRKLLMFAYNLQNCKVGKAYFRISKMHIILLLEVKIGATLLTESILIIKNAQMYWVTPNLGIYHTDLCDN